MKHALRRQRASSLLRLAVFFLCCIAAVSAKAQPAIAGYTGLGTYNGHYYYISEAFYYGNQISTAVADARTKILALEPSRPGSHVYAAAILNKPENDFIQNAVLAYNTSRYAGTAPPVTSLLYTNLTPGAKSTFPNWGDVRNPWIGLTDVGTEGTFGWSNGQPNCEDFRNWNTGEPNNYTGPVSNGEDYTQMLLMSPYLLDGNPNHDPLGKWNDWFNQDIIDPSGTNLGFTRLPVIIEVGPADCSRLDVSLSGTTKVSCFGDDNGTASFQIAAGTPPFTYSLNGGSYSAPFNTNAFTVSELEAGDYSLTVRDANGNEKTVAFTITQPAAPLDAQSSLLVNVKCNGNSTGSVTISATGGTAPYSGTGTFSNLAAGEYTYTVTDANGCTDQVSVVITEPGKLLVDATDEKPACNGNNGSVTITASGGTPPYSGTGVKTGLAPGNNTFTVTDANGCTQSITVFIDGTGSGSFNAAPETFPNRFNSWFFRSLSNATFAGSAGTWTVNSNAYATMVVTAPYYSPSSSYALKVVNFKTTGCGAGSTKAVSPKWNLTGPCCPNEVKLNFTLWTYEVTAGDNKAKLEIDFSADGGSTWTEVWSKTSAQLHSAHGDGGKTTVQIPVPVSYHTANFRYRIRGEMDAEDCNNMYLFVDDINITAPAVCTPPATIGDFVWKDLNGNGRQDDGEPGLANVTVKLTSSNGTVQTKTTNANGAYSFGGLLPGTYTVSFTTPAGYVPATANQGSDDKDSDPVSGSVTVTVVAGQTNNTVDAGFKVPACTNTTNHNETFPNKFNSYFNTSLYNACFNGSTGTWTVNSNSRATMVVMTPHYSPSSSYALKVVNYKTANCASGWTKAVSPKVDLSAPCCPSELKMTFTLWTYKVVAGDHKAKLEIDFSSNNGSTWTEVWSKTSGQLYTSHGANGKTTVTISVPAGFQTGNFRYRIRGEMASDDCNNFYVYLDDIKIGSPASCSSGARTVADNARASKGESVVENSAPVEAAVAAKAPEAIVADEPLAFSVTAFPNPTNNEFTLRLTSKETEVVTVRVFDVTGKLVKQIRTAPNQSIRFGAEFKNGSYLAEVVQGKRKEVVKLMKL